MMVSKNDKKFARIILATILLGLTGCVQQIDYETIRSMMDSYFLKDDRIKAFVIVDIRSPAKWHAGCIQDAFNIPYDTFLDADKNLISSGEALTSIITDKQRKIIIYSDDAERTRNFADIAVSLGYFQVYYYSGGIDDWKANGEYLVMS